MQAVITKILQRIKSAKNGIDRKYSSTLPFGICLGKEFEAIDTEMSKLYKTDGYTVERRASRSLQYKFDDVSFKRRKMNKAMSRRYTR